MDNRLRRSDCEYDSMLAPTGSSGNDSPPNEQPAKPPTAATGASSPSAIGLVSPTPAAAWTEPPTAATGASSPSGANGTEPSGATESASPTPSVAATSWAGLSDEETNVGSLSTRSATGPESPEETEEEKKEAEHNESSGCDADDFPEKMTLSTVERTFWVDSPAYYEDIGWCSCNMSTPKINMPPEDLDERFHRCYECFKFIKDPQEDHRRVNDIGTGGQRWTMVDSKRASSPSSSWPLSGKKRKAAEESAPEARASKLRSQEEHPACLVAAV